MADIAYFVQQQIVIQLQMGICTHTNIGLSNFDPRLSPSHQNPFTFKDDLFYFVWLDRILMQLIRMIENRKDAQSMAVHGHPLDCHDMLSHKCFILTPVLDI